MTRQRRGRCGPIAAIAALLVLSACWTNPSSNASLATGDRLHVAAAENVWGSIAKQLAGSRATVTSIITNPNTDPHAYEPSAQDERTIASARYVIVNGIGYDAWATKALDANPAQGRTVLDVGDLLGKKEGDNPHRWYFPTDVDTVINRITSDYKKVDPGDADYFDKQKQRLETSGLATYHRLIAEIKQKYAGTPVGASESIFVGMALATGLDLVTPAAYLTAISEGTDPTAADKATVDRQISERQIKVFVYNSQNATPDVATLVNAARAKRMPVTTVTETLTPATATFEQWQSAQLQTLKNALASATGK